MQIYFAPLEGITGFIFRNAYEKYYGGIDKYFTPFITPHTKKNMDTRERRDILPENNKGGWRKHAIRSKRRSSLRERRLCPFA